MYMRMPIFNTKMFYKDGNMYSLDSVMSQTDHDVCEQACAFTCSFKVCRFSFHEWRINSEN